MSTVALQRTVRRCTAIVVAVLGFGFDGTASFDGTLLVIGALAYLLVSGFLGLSRRYDEQVGLSEDESGATDADGETPS